jgi:hypothetical protein
VATKVRVIARRTHCTESIVHEGSTSPSSQVKVLTDLVKLLVKAMEEQRLDQAKHIGDNRGTEADASTSDCNPQRDVSEPNRNSRQDESNSD